MPEDLKQMNIRLSPTTRGQLETLAERLSEQLGFPVTMTDAIRHLVAEASARTAMPVGVEPTAPNLFGNFGLPRPEAPPAPKRRKARAA